jgi:catechol 2,3-dioxygenase-like lactoylglutathione lyase family enzyme
MSIDPEDASFGLPRLPPSLTALLMRGFFAWHKLAHRVRHGFRLRVRRIDHVTLPCKDLAAAERFYVGLLGARVMLRVDAEFMRRMGRPAEEAARGSHLSVVFDGGPRLDLFQYADGQPPPLADHPHLALEVSPRDVLAWRARLEAAGVPTDGPRRLGPRGQASLYFNDPSGNHLELTALGFRGPLPVGAPTMAKLLPRPDAAR